jgi:hypothetical protein
MLRRMLSQKNTCLSYRGIIVSEIMKDDFSLQMNVSEETVTEVPLN